MRLIHWWKLVTSPTNNNETLSIELQEAWELACNSRACRHCMSTGSYGCDFVWLDRE